MNIAALVNPAPEVPRRSPSNSHSISAPSPALSAAKLPTPPLSTHKPMPQKRKRHDPKPIWAIREHEVIDGKHQEQREQRQQSRPPPPTPRPQPQPPPQIQRNGPPSFGPPPPIATRELIGYERPISDDPQVYDEMSRQVCDFIWTNVVKNEALRSAIAQSPSIQVEIEARWGQIKDRNSGRRLVGIHDSECIVKSHVSETTKFESTMSMEQHRRMNGYLNNQVQKAKQPGIMRTSVDYKHTKEVDLFYELDQSGFDLLPPLTRQLIARSATRQRIRVTRDEKTKQFLRAIIKHRIANLEISSPQTEWDYRIGINLEIEFPGPVESLNPAVEAGRTVEEMKRTKDRVSYSWLGAYQIDLTQVTQNHNLNHELELEVDPKLLLHEAEGIENGVPNNFESLMAGMMNNLRVLSREITPPAPA